MTNDLTDRERRQRFAHAEKLFPVAELAFAFSDDDDNDAPPAEEQKPHPIDAKVVALCADGKWYPATEIKRDPKRGIYVAWRDGGYDWVRRVK